MENTESRDAIGFARYFERVRIVPVRSRASLHSPRHRAYLHSNIGSVFATCERPSYAARPTSRRGATRTWRSAKVPCTS